MKHFLSSSLFLVAVWLRLTASAPLVLPSTFDVTAWGLDGKNAGALDGSIDTDDDDTDESIRWGSTAQERGLQLQLITQALDALGEVTAAQSMLSLADMQGNGTESQSSVASNTLGEYFRYYDGPVLSQVGKTDSLSVFLIFYGKKWKAGDVRVVENFVNSFVPAKAGGEDDRTVDRWWDITTNYYHDFKNRSIPGKTVLKKSLFDTGSQAPFGVGKKSLKDTHIRAIVRKGIETWGKPYRNSMYFVLTSEEVMVKNFGDTMCTYHSSFRSQNMNIAYAFVGNPATQALRTCTYRYYDTLVETVNGVAIDGVVNWIAHSMTKMATNPYPNKKGKKGWVVASSGFENADLCAWIFGYTGFKIVPPQNYYTWNLKGVNNTYYLIQKNYNRKLKACVIIGRDKEDQPPIDK